MKKAPGTLLAPGALDDSVTGLRYFAGPIVIVPLPVCGGNVPP